MIADAYPSERQLSRIREWSTSSPDDCRTLAEFVRSLWWHDCDEISDNGEWKPSTWGWSGNEALIRALQDNHVWWSLCWWSSRRGGHYVFRLN